jgi:hypothetical protein
MSYSNKKQAKGPPHVQLLWSMLNGKAYRCLPPSAAKALPFFIGKIKKSPANPERYDLDFSFTYREGRRLGFAFSTFFKIIQDLVSFGFIDPVDKGGLKSNCKSCSVFRLSRRWEAYGTDKFESSNWKCFIPKASE